MEHAYLIRCGLMGQVARFSSELASLQRGQTVVVRSHRGTELGEVLVEVSPAPSQASPPPSVSSARVLRPADPDDFDRAHRAGLERSERFALCQRLLTDGVWPLELIDVEPLLDERRTVLHYLGPHDLDTDGLRAVFLDACGLDVVLEPVGRDAPEVLAEEQERSQGCESCGSEGGGCCSSGSGAHAGGCSDCGVKKLLGARKAAVASH